MSGWYEFMSWVVLAAGLLPAAWFAATFGRRVRRPWSLAAFDAGGWVFALLAVYAFQAVVYLTLGVPTPPAFVLGAARIALGVLLDAVIVARAVAWQRLRADYRRRSPVGEGPNRRARRRL